MGGLEELQTALLDVGRRGKGRLDAGGMTLINFSVWRTDFECSLMDSIPFEMETNQ